jgi:hypothetical protein
LATFETSLYDEHGEKRSDFGLGDVFGVSFDGRVEGPMKNSYLRCEKEYGQYHPVLEGLHNTSRIINGVYRLDIQAIETFPSPLTLIPSYPDLPMEHVYPREPRTDIREIYLREIGQGRVAYIPWDIDRTFWEILNVDHGKLIRNALQWALRYDQPVEVKGQGILDVTIWQQKKSMTVHLVNLTNPMMMKGPFRELIPLTGQELIIQIPPGKKVTGATFLVAGTSPDLNISSDKIMINVPQILDHEVIALDLE